MMTSLALTTLLLSSPALAQRIEGMVTRVIDGDTFAISALRIRICGIDAPERRTPGGSEATQALSALIGSRRVVCIPVGAGSVCDGRSKPVNRGRIVAQCFVGGADIAARLVSGGFACDWVKFSGGAYRGGCRK